MQDLYITDLNKPVVDISGLLLPVVFFALRFDCPRYLSYACVCPLGLAGIVLGPVLLQICTKVQRLTSDTLSCLVLFFHVGLHAGVGVFNYLLIPSRPLA